MIRLLTSIIIIIIFLVIYLILFEVPSNDELKNPDIKIESSVFDLKGRSLGTYRLENRIPLKYSQLNPELIKALIASEDTRFYKHSGIDIKALLRVLFKTIILSNKESGGGSTITQQLAKQLYKRPYLKNKFFLWKYFLLFKSKLKEWIIALKLENIYSKEDILSMYLNKFEFINGAHGIESASITYFGKSQSALSLSEICTLIGMLKNPSLYNPIRYKRKTWQRRNEVLEKIEKLYNINLDSIKKTELNISNYKRIEHNVGPVPYFKYELAKWLTNMIRENQLLKPDGKLYDIYSDGLSIETTIDLDFQKYAEEASLEHMKLLQKEFLKQWKGKDPWTFEASQQEKLYRKNSLFNKVKDSERFKAIKQKYLTKSHLLLKSHLLDEVLFNICMVDQDSNVLYKNKYNFSQNVMDELTLFKESYKKEFLTKINMNVFDHELGEKNLEMSPFDSVIYHAMILQNAIIIMNPKNGEINSWVGGLNHKYFKYDHVTPRRSVGSTLKPFLYTLAMTKYGIKPCQTYKDIEYSIEPFESDFENKERWAPHNATEIYTTLKYNLYHGLLYSKNSVSVKLLKDMGTVEPLRDLLHQVGLDKNEKLSNGRLAIPKLPSVALGSVDINLIQLTAAYATFANGGTYHSPVFIKSIKDKFGNIIYKPTTVKRFVIDSLFNSIIVDMLKNNVSGEFTMNLKSENGGKTGTTNDQSDGYYIGITPTLVGGVWTGGGEKWIRFANIDIGQGYFTARPAFERFMKKIELDKKVIYNSRSKFQAPPKGFKELTNCIKFKTEPLPEFLRPKMKFKESKDTIR